MSTPPPVTVVVPVYAGVDDVRRCLDSVLRHARTGKVPVELLVIDDATPEPAVRQLVDRYAKDGGGPDLTVIHHDENLGFVASVNRGIAETTGDVVVLNADTVVTEGWLDRLVDAATGTPDVATVTPLTNFGSICTVPSPVIEAFGLDGDDPRVDDCATFVEANSLGLRPRVITGVGFCMYVRREAVDQCGPFDEATFGLGYGEEVDFCLRATRLGFVHLVEDRTFVYHRGGGSFGERRQEGLVRGSTLLHERYPFFRAANTLERRSGELALCHLALEQALDQRLPDRPHVLHLLHNTPDALGGTEKHLDALLGALRADHDFSILYPVESGFVLRTRWLHDDGEPREHEYLLPGGPRRVTAVDDTLAGAALQLALDLFHVDAVHIHNLIGHSLAPLRVLADFPGPVICSVRDLYLACPNHSLLFLNESPCGIPEDLSLCAQCLPVTVGLGDGVNTRGTPAPLDYLERFRAEVSDHLGTVDRWVCASHSAADYLLRAYAVDEARIEIIEHGAIIEPVEPLPGIDEARILDEPLRLAFVGIGRTKKGMQVVNDLAEHTAGRGIEVHHFGEMKEAASPALVVHGVYDNHELPQILHASGIQIVLLPGPYAETFGHVLTEALVSGLPVIGTGYGALGERIRRDGVGWTVDPEDRPGIRDLVDHLDQCRLEILRATRRARSVVVDPVASTADRYAALYRGPERVPRGEAAP